MRRCRTCKHWAKAAQGDDDFGNCEAIPAADDVRTGVAPAESQAFANSTEGIGGAWLETRATFGCTLWAGDRGGVVVHVSEVPPPLRIVYVPVHDPRMRR